MKKKFEELYPYLAYWLEDWGEMQTTAAQYGHSRIMLTDEGGVCYEDQNSRTFDDALQKAEAYIREVESERFDQASIISLEEDYKKYGLE